LLNCSVKGNGILYPGDSLWIGDEVFDYDSVMAEWASFNWADHTREQAEYFKDFFAALNEYTTWADNVAGH
jgi:hypothetical protein